MASNIALNIKLLSVILLGVIMLRIIMRSVITLNVVMLSVVMLNVVAPELRQGWANTGFIHSTFGTSNNNSVLGLT